MTYAFGPENKSWILEKLDDLYEARLNKNLLPDNNEIEKNLRRLAKIVNTLILWLDCDREGENIAFEVIDIVRQENPNLNILRAHFSALTFVDINRSMETLQPPNKNLSDAVEIRQKIDLIIGASFTRLQTICFKNLFFKEDISVNNKSYLSYGPCQFPTLNFIVERTEKIRNFKREEFYSIDLRLEVLVDEKKVEVCFNWKRYRLFDKLITLTLFEKLIEAKKVKIVSVSSNPRVRFRPVPLNTVEMQKLISRKLKINSSESMKIAEKLYQNGFISYPRTETQKFSKNQDLKKLIEEQTESEDWGRYAQRLLSGIYMKFN